MSMLTTMDSCMWLTFQPLTAHFNFQINFLRVVSASRKPKINITRFMLLLLLSNKSFKINVFFFEG